MSWVACEWTYDSIYLLFIFREYLWQLLEVELIISPEELFDGELVFAFVMKC